MTETPMMEAQKPQFTRRILIFVIIGLVVLSLYVYYFIRTTNVADTLARTNMLLYASAFVAFLATVFFSSLAWQSLLRNLNVKARISRVLLLMWSGLFFDVVVPEPGFSGDLSKAYMLAKTYDEDPGRIVASVVSQKIISIVITVVSLFLGLSLLALHYTLSSLVLLFIAAVIFLSVFVLVLVTYISARPAATRRMLNWLIRAIDFFRRGRWDPEDFRNRAETTLYEFHEGFRTLISNPKDMIMPITLCFISWGFDVSVVFLTFVALGYPLPVDQVLIVYALTGALASVGISFVGVTEIIMTSSYTLLGIPLAYSLSATLLTRVITLWFKLVVSYFAFQYAGVQILLGKKPST
jgi:uncharacterized protein (TIRG00374 family)